MLIQSLVEPVTPLTNHTDMFLSVGVKILCVQIVCFLAEEVFLAQFAGCNGVARGRVLPVNINISSAEELFLTDLTSVRSVSYKVTFQF